VFTQACRMERNGLSDQLQSLFACPTHHGAACRSGTYAPKLFRVFSITTTYFIQLTTDNYHPLVCSNSSGFSFDTSSPRIASPSSSEHSATTWGSL
jgi:hypothetical protein